MAQPYSQPLPHILTLSDILNVTETESFQNELIDGLSKGFRAFAQKQFHAAPIQTLGAPPMAPFIVASQNLDNYSAQTCVKSGYFYNHPYYVIKVASGGAPWPENSGSLQIYSQTTGRLEALLLDEGILTELRTAAVGALATKLFAPRDIQCIGFVGTGTQARYQLEMLQRVTCCRRVLVYGRSKDKLKAYQTEMQTKGWNVHVVNEPDELLSQCQLIITTTSARQPVLGGGGGNTNCKLKNLLIICIGSDAPGKMELSQSLIAQADVKVADDPEQSKQRGEFQLYDGDDPVFALGDAIDDPSLQRSLEDKDERFIIFDSSGVALQDCVIADMVYRQVLLPSLSGKASKVSKICGW